MPVRPVPASAMYRRTRLKASIKTTNDLPDVETLIGQDRALEAVRFAARMRARGYNIFVIGPKGSGKHMAVRKYLEERARNLPSPNDWVYVQDFSDTHRPKALELPTGGARDLAERMHKLVADLKDSARTVFEGDEYRLRREALDKEYRERGETAMHSVAEAAKQRDLVLLQTPQGLAITPAKDGKPMPTDHFEALPQVRRERLQKDIHEVQEMLIETLRKAPGLERDRQRAIRALNREISESLIHEEIAELRDGLATTPQLDAWIETVATDLVENIRLFIDDEEQGPPGLPQMLMSQQSGERAPVDPLRRYAVNVLVGNETNGGAPVVMEDNPTLGRLVGRIEYRVQMGALLTDFTLINAGTLHRANGGYLLLDAQKILTNPFSWDALKRALYADKVSIESPWETSSTVSTLSIQPEPIPLSVKVALFGDMRLYLLLCQLDPDFADLFKVAADFDELMERDQANETLYARMVATVQRREKLRPFERAAIERVIEHCSRLVSDAERISARVGLIADVMREADYRGRDKRHRVIRAADVAEALAAQRHRSDRIEVRSREQILRETVLIATEGTAVGQVNGLSVLQIGATAFGRPTRITARTRMGQGRVIDIEREVDLGGPLHSKGMLILQGYLAATYAQDVPISLQASLVFEQSYGGVDGDSASSTELYALLSSLAGTPIKQGIAVTGSVNQMGEVQAIGGVNEKIEGFFDVCAARGLTGEQGVLIPAANRVNLMLKPEVIDAVKAGKFRVWAVSTISEGIEILTGTRAGKRDAKGKFPKNSINRRVEDQLIRFAETRRDFSRPAKAGGDPVVE